MNKSYFLINALIALLFLASCGGKDSVGSAEDISGKDSKAWHAVKQLDRQGNKKGMTDEEEDDELRFSSNGTFTLYGEADHKLGKWKFDKSKATLSLQYAGQSLSENFVVLNLKDDEMKLQSPDGSQLILEAKE